MSRNVDQLSMLDYTEGYRYLARQVRIALEDSIEFAAPWNLGFEQYSDPTRKVGIDNPDTVYLRAIVDPENAYVIEGRRGNASYVSVDLYRGYYGEQNAEVGIVRHYRLDDFELGPNGEVTITLGGVQDAANWIPLEGEADRVEIHQTFGPDSDREPGDFAIRCRSSGLSEEVETSDRLVAALRRASDQLQFGTELWAEFTEGWITRPNELARVRTEVVDALQGNLDTIYWGGYWQLQPNEHLEVQFVQPGCSYWGLQIANHWLESYDYRYARCNVSTIDAEPGPLIQITIGPGEFGAPYWIDTQQHDRGVAVLRMLNADRIPTVQTRVVSSGRPGPTSGV